MFFWDNKKSLEKEKNLSEKFFVNSNFRKITKSFLTEIIVARIEEILKIIKKEIRCTGLSLTSGQNVLLTGVGSTLPNLQKFSSDYFDTNVKLLKFKNLDSCEGALNIIFNGWDTEAIPERMNNNHKRKGFLSKMLGNWA